MTETVIHCRHNVAAWLLIFVGMIFVLIGCENVYRWFGFTEEQVAEQTAKDAAAVEDVVEHGREIGWQIATTVIAGVGAVVSGLLGKWLGTERKISRAVIAGVEAADKQNVKEAIKREALSLGVESKLHKRVEALTA